MAPGYDVADETLCTAMRLDIEQANAFDERAVKGAEKVTEQLV